MDQFIQTTLLANQEFLTLFHEQQKRMKLFKERATVVQVVYDQLLTAELNVRYMASVVNIGVCLQELEPCDLNLAAEVNANYNMWIQACNDVDCIWRFYVQQLELLQWV